MSDTEREHDEPLLTKAQVRRWIELSKEYGEKKSALDRRIEAARMFMSPDDWDEQVQNPTQYDKPDVRLPSWTSVIMAGLKKAGKGLSYDELREVVKISPLAKRLKRSDKGFYGAVGKLEVRGEVKRHNGRVFTIKAHKEFLDAVNAGLAEDKPVKSGSRRSPMGEFIEALVSKNPNGIEGKHIIAELRGTEAFAATVTRNSSAAYNVLSRLVKQRRIRKDEKVYFPISGDKEHTDPISEQSLNGKGSPFGDPSTGEGATSPVIHTNHG